MTKRWSSTRSDLTLTKREASKMRRALDDAIIITEIKAGGEVVFQKPQYQTCNCTAIHVQCQHYR